jgi:hypothetical protein
VIVWERRYRQGRKQERIHVPEISLPSGAKREPPQIAALPGSEMVTDPSMNDPLKAANSARCLSCSSGGATLTKNADSMKV